MEEYFIQTEQLTVGYDGKPLIKDIEIRLKKGEILTLIGPNGAGNDFKKYDPAAETGWRGSIPGR